MKILAIEFSSDRRSVAVLSGSTVRATAAETGGRATKGVGMIEAVLAEAGVELEQVGCIAVGLGPGSYTGIRAAIAMAQGWQLAGGADPVRLLGVSSVECLARQAQEGGCHGKVNIVIDAQRNELYLAGYEVTADRISEVEPLRLATVDEGRKRAQAGEWMVGPEAARWFDGGRVVFPDAVTLGILAADRTDFVSGEKIEPIYLRETTFVKAPLPRELPPV